MYTPDENPTYDISEDLKNFKIKTQNFLYKLRNTKDNMFKSKYFNKPRSENSYFSDSESSGLETLSSSSVILSGSSDSEDECSSITSSSSESSIHFYRCLLNRVKPELIFLDELKYIFAKHNKLPYANELVTRDLHIFFDNDSFIIDKF